MVSGSEDTSLTTDLWTEAAGVYDKILAHPFLVGLTRGDLDRQAFRYYVLQDAHYLHAYARTLSLLAARGPDEGATELFARHASDAIAVERALHAEILRELEVSEERAAAEPIAPTTLAYTSFLLAAAYGGTFPEALGAVLPCYWLYWEVGKALAARSSPDPLYARWIATYGGEDFARIVGDVLALTDRAGAGIDAGERERVRGRFAVAARYEWMFWDAAYRREAWPL